MSELLARPTALTLRARDRVLDLRSRVLIAGIVNVTPDSFSDGGRYLDPEAAVDHAAAMVEQGADLIDIGGESSRPGSEPVGTDEELRRVMPVVRAVCRKVPVPVSVDTIKAAVARQALDAGAVIVNDISALRFDPEMAQVVARAGAGLVLMHMQGTPKTMQQAPSYRDVVAEVRDFFRERLAAAARAGIAAEQILLDPGIGFGKNLEHNLKLIDRLDRFVELGRPLMIGPSRKAFIGQVLERAVSERLMGTAAVVAVALLRGARVVRVHDVAPIRDVVRMVEAIIKSRTDG
jgi:dihydropteroate synthase